MTGAEKIPSNPIRIIPAWEVSEPSGLLFVRVLLLQEWNKGNL